MDTFVQKHAHSIMGISSGFDRLAFRGSLLQLSYAEGMKSYLNFSHHGLATFQSADVMPFSWPETNQYSQHQWSLQR